MAGLEPVKEYTAAASLCAVRYCLPEGTSDAASGDQELLCADRNSCGYPDLSYHSDRAWYCDFSRTTRQFGCMYAGGYAGESGFIYIAYNLYWTEQTFALPLLAEHASWYRVMDTSEPESFLLQPEALGKIRSFRVPPRTIMILEGREDETE